MKKIILTASLMLAILGTQITYGSDKPTDNMSIPNQEGNNGGKIANIETSNVPTTSRKGSFYKRRVVEDKKKSYGLNLSNKEFEGYLSAEENYKNSGPKKHGFSRGKKDSIKLKEIKKTFQEDKLNDANLDFYWDDFKDGIKTNKRDFPVNENENIFCLSEGGKSDGDGTDNKYTDSSFAINKEMELIKIKRRIKEASEKYCNSIEKLDKFEAESERQPFFESIESKDKYEKYELFRKVMHQIESARVDAGKSDKLDSTSKILIAGANPKYYENNNVQNSQVSSGGSQGQISSEPQKQSEIPEIKIGDYWNTIDSAGCWYSDDETVKIVNTYRCIGCNITEVIQCYVKLCQKYGVNALQRLRQKIADHKDIEIYERILRDAYNYIMERKLSDEKNKEVTAGEVNGLLGLRQIMNQMLLGTTKMGDSKRDNNGKIEENLWKEYVGSQANLAKVKDELINTEKTEKSKQCMKILMDICNGSQVIEEWRRKIEFEEQKNEQTEFENKQLDSYQQNLYDEEMNKDAEKREIVTKLSNRMYQITEGYVNDLADMQTEKAEDKHNKKNEFKSDLAEELHNVVEDVNSAVVDYYKGLNKKALIKSKKTTVLNEVYDDWMILKTQVVKRGTKEVIAPIFTRNIILSKLTESNGNKEDDKLYQEFLNVVSDGITESLSTKEVELFKNDYKIIEKTGRIIFDKKESSDRFRDPYINSIDSNGSKLAIGVSKGKKVGKKRVFEKFDPSKILGGNNWKDVQGSDAYWTLVQKVISSIEFDEQAAELNKKENQKICRVQEIEIYPIVSYKTNLFGRDYVESIPLRQSEKIHINSPNEDNDLTEGKIPNSYYKNSKRKGLKTGVINLCKNIIISRLNKKLLGLKDNIADANYANSFGEQVLMNSILRGPDFYKYEHNSRINPDLDTYEKLLTDDNWEEKVNISLNVDNILGRKMISMKKSEEVNKEYNKKINEMQQNINDLQKEKEELTKSVAEIETIKSDLNKKNNEISILKSDLLELRKSYNNTKSQHDTAVTEKAEFDKQNKSLIKHNNECEKQIMELKEKLEAASKEKDDLSKTLTVANKEVERIEELNKQIKKLENDKVNLEAAKEKYDENVSKIKKEKTELENKIETLQNKLDANNADVNNALSVAESGKKKLIEFVDNLKKQYPEVEIKHVTFIGTSEITKAQQLRLIINEQQSELKNISSFVQAMSGKIKELNEENTEGQKYKENTGDIKVINEQLEQLQKDCDNIRESFKNYGEELQRTIDLSEGKKTEEENNNTIEFTEINENKNKNENKDTKEKIKETRIQGRVIEIAKAIKSMNDEYTGLKVKIESIDKKLNNLITEQSKYKETSDRNVKLNKDIIGYNDKFQEIFTYLSNLKQQLDGIKINDGSKIISIDDFSSPNEEDNTNKPNNNNKPEKETDEFTKKYNLAKEEIGNISTAVLNLQNKVNYVNDDIIKPLADFEKTLKSYVNKPNKSSKGNNDDKQMTPTQVIENIKKYCEVMQNNIIQLQISNTELQKQIDENENNINNIEIKIVKENTKLSNEIENVDDGNNKDKKIQELTAENSMLKEKNKELLEQIEQLKAQLQKQESQLKIEKIENKDSDNEKNEKKNIENQYEEPLKEEIVEYNDGNIEKHEVKEEEKKDNKIEKEGMNDNKDNTEKEKNDKENNNIEENKLKEERQRTVNEKVVEEPKEVGPSGIDLTSGMNQLGEGDQSQKEDQKMEKESQEGEAGTQPKKKSTEGDRENKFE